MKRHKFNTANTNPSLKWKAGLLLFLFALCNVVIIYENIHTFSKQKYSLSSDEDIPVFEELDEEEAGSSHTLFSPFIPHFHHVKVWEDDYEVWIHTFCKLPISLFTSTPLFIRNRVLRL